jgi:Predicted 3-hydroxylacyl-(acyl carrier protein) dehydratase
MKQCLISDLQLIKQLIPQRSPMIMVDALLEYDSTSALVGFTITKKNIFVQGGRLSASGLIEHMAQSVALHKGYAYYLNNQPAPMGYIGAIKQIEIYQLPEIGIVLKTHINIIQEFLEVTLVRIETYLGGTCICQGEMKTVLAK